MEDYRSIIERLNLLPHPEGGYYRRNWQSVIEAEARDASGKTIHSLRSIGSSILYLLPSNEASAWHRLSCDEMWHHYLGSSLKMYLLSGDGKLEERVLGKDMANGEMPQVIVPRSTWFCAEVLEPDSYSFCGCTLWPSFSYADFDLADKNIMLKKFPQFEELINRIFAKSNII